MAQQSGMKAGLSSITPGMVLIAVLGAAVCTAVQFYFQVTQADHRLSGAVDQLITTLEVPAARSVLILDSELAEDIATGLTKLDFITQVRILEDHGVPLAETGTPTPQPPSALEAMVAPVVGSEHRISKRLPLPESMSEASGEIILVYNRARGVAFLSGNMTATLIATFLITTVLLLAAFSLAARRD
jgi:hypothetical protein